MKARGRKALAAVAFLAVSGFISGCGGGDERAGNHQIWFMGSIFNGATGAVVTDYQISLTYGKTTVNGSVDMMTGRYTLGPLPAWNDYAVSVVSSGYRTFNSYNAGIAPQYDRVEDVSENLWDKVLGVNLKGAFLVGQAVAREMAKSGGGAIVNMSSVNGVMAIPTIASYNASKGGINQLTRVMALSLADRGIRVNAVAPGTIATELAQKAVLGSAEARERIMSRTPMRRLGEPGEIASVCAFLASDAASYMTGEIVVVDGGRLALNYTMPPLPAA